MKSGLEGRNNVVEVDGVFDAEFSVSMKSGLEGRNNSTPRPASLHGGYCLNEVRPRRPEQ